MTNLASIAEELSAKVSRLSFQPPVAQVYNPLEYAREAHRQYLDRFGAGPKEVVLLGMNPGPWGMVQTGVPFGEIDAVTNWMGIHSGVQRPAVEHPKRPVDGFDCKRSEVSGRRLWGWAREHFETPEDFFDRFFVVNHCPLVFMEESGRNLTPDKLRSVERKPLLGICDRALRAQIELLEPQWVVGVGRFAEQRALIALDGLSLRVGRGLHPSPASPAANRGWAEQWERDLAALGIVL